MYVLHGHPLSSYFQKAAIAFYETETPFELAMVGNLFDPEEKARFQAIWPTGKMPVLEDKGRGRVIGESSIVIEYLAMHEPGAARLLPRDPDTALRVRLLDRLFDAYLETPFQRMATYGLKLPGSADPAIPDLVKADIAAAYRVIDGQIGEGDWAVGDTFTLADCSAAPALFFANRIVPMQDNHPKLAAYHARLSARPSYARALAGSEPYLANVPF